MGYELKSPITSVRLAHALGLDHRGPSILVTQVCSYDNFSPGALMFMKSPGLDFNFQDVLIIAPQVANFEPTFAHIVSAGPRLDFMRALHFIEKNIGFTHSVDPPVVHPTARVSTHASLENGVNIGAYTVIEPHVYLHAGTRVGSNCLIRCGADIGGDGFGYERLDDGTPLKFVHLGGVEIGSHVEIGANTCIARGTLGNTLIEDYVKIDNLVHIAHNCKIGRGAFIIAGAEVSGGVHIGQGAWIGPNAAIIQQVRIGAGSTVGIGAVVTKDVSENQTVAGSPAQEISEFIRCRKLLSSLCNPSS